MLLNSIFTKKIVKYSGTLQAYMHGETYSMFLISEAPVGNQSKSLA